MYPYCCWILSKTPCFPDLDYFKFLVCSNFLSILQFPIYFSIISASLLKVFFIPITGLPDNVLMALGDFPCWPRLRVKGSRNHLLFDLLEWLVTILPLNHRYFWLLNKFSLATPYEMYGGKYGELIWLALQCQGFIPMAYEIFFCIFCSLSTSPSI